MVMVADKTGIDCICTNQLPSSIADSSPLITSSPLVVLAPPETKKIMPMTPNCVEAPIQHDVFQPDSLNMIPGFLGPPVRASTPPETTIDVAPEPPKSQSKISKAANGGVSVTPKTQSNLTPWILLGIGVLIFVGMVSN